MDKKTFTSVDEYIESFAPETSEILSKIRAVIKDTAPNADEKISYQMPSYKLNGNLVHFAAFKKHIGFFLSTSAIEQFADRLTNYKTSKGTIQFPLNKPIPYELISDIVKFRVSENLK